MKKMEGLAELEEYIQNLRIAVELFGADAMAIKAIFERVLPEMKYTLERVRKL